MKLEQRESGLVVPSPEPRPPEPTDFGPLEIRDELRSREAERRRQAHSALLALWDAMDLSTRPLLATTTEQRRKEAQYMAYQFFGTMLLGDDCPEREVFT